LVDLTVTGPDYVFKKDYNLPTLTELKTYTDKNQHLPGVPAAAEMEKNGINLVEMNMVLLKKVEELTLYLMDANKIADKQTKDMDGQKKTIESQEERITTLEKQLNALTKLITKN
jgi:hypothetical protein